MKKLLLTLLTICLIVPVAAQLQNGKIYRFKNKADNNIALTATSFSDVYGKAADMNDWNQFWLAETHPKNKNAWAFRSLGNGLYLQWNTTSQGWTFKNTAAESTNLYYIEDGDYFTLNNSTSRDMQCMHYATSQGGRIVGWTPSANATLWSHEEITLNAEDIQKNWDELNEFVEKITPEYLQQCKDALNNLFSDKACTTLKKNFATVAAMKADDDYKKLPAELQNMVRKVITNDWSENNFNSNKPGWSSEQAKKFRVQSIEPYSIAGEITSHLGINAHINMDNPTGIFGNSRQHVYIMVEGEIKSGSELWVNNVVGHGTPGDYNSGTRLYEGLNIVPFSGNGNALYLNYVVHTYNSSTKSFPNKLSDFADLKVHIEGGNINSYYNAVGDYLWGEPDNDEDWQYYEERANLENITILGKGQILHFCLNDTQYEEDGKTYIEKGMSYYLPNNIQVPANTPANQKINTMLEAWDRIHFSELATMGLLSKAAMDSLNALYPRYDENWKNAGEIYNYSEAMYETQKGKDYSEYFNHHGLAYGNFSGYMSGGWRNCNYHHNTMGSIIGEIAVNAGSTWGPGHEIGHQHQGPLTVNGLTEVTNNLFSNIAVWYMGLGTSRVNGDEGKLGNVNTLYQAGENYLFHHHINSESQNLWTQTQMYYKLWLYYHRCGHKTDFYPILFELLRQKPLSRNALGSLPHTDDEGKTSNISHTSGKASILLFYKLACQAAGEDLTEFFRAHGFFTVMNQRLRGDYSNSFYTQTQEEIDNAIAEVKAMGYKENFAPLFVNDCVATPTYSHDGKTQRSYWDNQTPQKKNAEIGLYVTAINKSVKAEGYYYSRSSKTNIEVKKQSDAAKGALGFMIYSDDELIAFSDFYKTTIPTKYSEKDIKVYAIQANGEKAELPSALEVGTDAEKLAALKDEISISVDYYNAIAKSTSNTGCFYAEATVDFKAAYDNAVAVQKNKEAAKYVEATLDLKEQRLALSEDSEMKWIPIKEKNYYTIESYMTTGLAITIVDNALKATSATATPLTSSSKQWEFIKAKGDNEFYIRNKDGQYISTISSGSQVITTSEKLLAGIFTPVRNTKGVFDLQQNEISINLNGALVQGGKNEVLGSLWKLTVIEDNATATEKAYLEKLIKNTESLIAKLVENENSESLKLNEGIVPLVEENILFDAIKALVAAKNKANEDKENTFDLYLCIAPVEKALSNLEGKYVIIPDLPEASTDENPVWYFIKSLEDELYCAVDTKGTNSSTKNAVKLQSLDGDEGNSCFYWAFYPTGKDGEYTIKSAKTGKEIYGQSMWDGGNVKADGKEDASTFTLTLVPDKYGFKIAVNDGYIYREGANSYIKATGDESNCRHWTIELVPQEIATGIQEVVSNNDVVKGIFDMMGRKISEITEPGLYIINGEKILVK